LIAADRVGPAPFEVACQPCRALNAGQLSDRKARLVDLFFQFLGPVKERRGEVIRIAGWIPVLPVSQIPLHDGNESRVIDEASDE